MIKIRYILFALLTAVLACFLTGCSQGILDPAGYVADQERRLLLLALILMCIVVIPVIILNFIIAFHYRASNKKAKYSPEWSHSVHLEFVIWTIPCIIILILAIMTWIYTHRLDPYRPLAEKGRGKPLTIEVVALDWRWLFIYPEQHIATINFMQIPVNRDVALLLTGDGSPMNSFEMPQLAGQIYVMPGMQTKLHFDAYKPGDYRGFSSNYSGSPPLGVSGQGFAGMKFTVRAGSDADFNAWVKKAQQSPDVLTQEQYNKLLPPSSDATVRLFTAPDNSLFNDLMMKYNTVIPASSPSADQHAKFITSQE